MSITLRHRRHMLELMDDPALPAAKHVAALRGLARINRWSHSADILWPSLRDLAIRNGRAGVRVLDVATGGGDVPIQLWRKAQQANLPLHIDACDRSGDALDHARANARAAGATVTFFTHDALAGPLPTGYDAVVSSLFLHHVEDAMLRPFLQNLAAAAGRLVLVNDLERSGMGYLAAWIGTRLLSRSPIVHYDGPASVRAALTVREARALAQSAGLHAATVTPVHPWRYLLAWTKP